MPFEHPQRKLQLERNDLQMFTKFSDRNRLSLKFLMLIRFGQNQWSAIVWDQKLRSLNWLDVERIEELLCR